MQPINVNDYMAAKQRNIAPEKKQAAKQRAIKKHERLQKTFKNGQLWHRLVQTNVDLLPYNEKGKGTQYLLPAGTTLLAVKGTYWFVGYVVPLAGRKVEILPYNSLEDLMQVCRHFKLKRSEFKILNKHFSFATPKNIVTNTLLQAANSGTKLLRSQIRNVLTGSLVTNY